MKLHLGSGKRYIPGWVHIDAIDYPHIDHVAQIDHLPFIQDNSVEIIYACHVLEHFKRRDVARVLKEWYRVLKPGGILRLAVPDFAAVYSVYEKTGSLEPLLGLLFGRQDYLYNIHYHVWDESTLYAALKNAGFGEVHHWDWRTTEHADVDDYSRAYLPHMDYTYGTLMSLNLEAVK
jgi:predicted SAM-dependent methyltransferase